MMVQLALFIFLPFRVRLALPVALLGTVGATLSVWVASSNGVHSITDLPNRRAFLDRLNAELARAQPRGAGGGTRHGRPQCGCGGSNFMST